MRSVAMIHGSIKGMGLTRRCDILAIREQLCEGGPVVYSRCCVIDELPEFPDGDYTASFRGHTVSMKKQGGLWLPSKDGVPADDEERHSDRGSESQSADGFLAILRKYSI
ncbi:MAG TPA: hypothetical protein VHZ09_08185 [Acidobacteriaceae bacterium]|jgi:hypothetical protein|nr:hypothetical protein [Acidobacteriaceae bacterium]